MKGAGGHVRDANRARWQAAAWALVGLVAAVLAVDWRSTDSLLLCGMAICCVVLAVRTMRSGIFFEDTDVVVRGVTRTQRFRRDKIDCAATMPGSIGNRRIRLVGVRLVDGRVIAPSTLVVAEGSEREETLIAGLNAALGDESVTR